MSGSFLWPDLAVGAVHLPARLCARRTLSCVITLEDYGAVEEIAAEWKMEMFALVGFKSEWFHLGEFIDGCENRGGCERVRSVWEGGWGELYEEDYR